jgi:hypothetical protein
VRLGRRPLRAGPVGGVDGPVRASRPGYACPENPVRVAEHESDSAGPALRDPNEQETIMRVFVVGASGAIGTGSFRR